MLTQKDQARLLSAIMNLEHKTKVRITAEEYDAIRKLAQGLQAPQYVTEYFARKAVETLGERHA